MAQCHEPKAGSPLIQHGMKATISPSFEGLTGVFVVEGEPDSDPHPVTRALGKVYYGSFEQSASSVDDGEGWEDWTLRRFVPNGGKTRTGGPDGTWESEVVRLSLVTERGDELDDFSPVNAEVLANAGTLQEGDLLRHETHGIFQVRGVLRQGAFERGRIER